MFTYKTVYPLKESREFKNNFYKISIGKKKRESTYYWKLVNHIDLNYINSLKKETKDQIYFFSKIILLIIILMSFVLVDVIIKKKDIKEKLLLTNKELLNKNTELAGLINEIEVIMKKLTEANKTRDNFFALI